MNYVGKDGQPVTVDPNAYYRLKLNATAYRGQQIPDRMLRPRDDNQVLGSWLDSIVPHDAIQWIERV